MNQFEFLEKTENQEFFIFEDLEVIYQPLCDTTDPLENTSGYLNLKGSIRSGLTRKKQSFRKSITSEDSIEDISADPLDEDYIQYEIKKVQHSIFVQEQ